MTTDEMRSQLANKVAESLHAAFAVILKHDKQFAIPEVIHFGLNTALSAIVSTVPFVANRPHLSSKEEISEKGADELVKLINYETIVFGALIVARMNGGIRIDKTENIEKIDDLEADRVCVSQSVDFGPDVLAMAIEDWKKLTGKDPYKYLDNNLLKSIENMQKAAATPFDEFLQKRLDAQGPTPSSTTLN